jgi:hypothetical protein
VWWHTPVILALRRPRPEDQEFKDSLRYIVRPCIKEKKLEFIDEECFQGELI